MRLKLVAFLVALLSVPATCQASIVFTFSEVGGNVIMTSSGTLETANLVAGTYNGWTGTGIGNFDNGAGLFAMIGGTGVGATDTAFQFSAGTDFSAWAGGVPFGSDTFGWSPSGIKGFATFAGDNSALWVPGIHLLRQQMDGTTWTPDQSWSIVGSFASLNMNPGTYTVADAVTGESITYQIGDRNASVPEPTSLMLFGSLIGLGLFVGRRKLKR